MMIQQKQAALRRPASGEKDEVLKGGKYLTGISTPVRKCATGRYKFAMFGVRRCLPLWLRLFFAMRLTNRQWMLTRRVICPLLSQ